MTPGTIVISEADIRHELNQAAMEYTGLSDHSMDVLYESTIEELHEAELPHDGNTLPLAVFNAMAVLETPAGMPF